MVELLFVISPNLKSSLFAKNKKNSYFVSFLICENPFLECSHFGKFLFCFGPNVGQAFIVCVPFWKGPI